MNYRFLKVTSYYQAFLDYFYQKNPDCKFKSYDEHLALLLDEAFGWGNFFQINLNKLGNDAYEIILNADFLQNTWARENKISTKSREDIFLHQLKTIKPEVLFLQDISAFNCNFISRIRSELKSIKLIVGWLCAPFTGEYIKSLSACDFVFSCSEHFLSQLKSLGLKCFRFNHAFEVSLLPRVIENQKYPATDFLFVGSLFPGSELHDLRVKIIDRILNENINLKVYSQIQNIPNLKIKQKAYTLYLFLKKHKFGWLYNIFPTSKRVSLYKEFPQNIEFSERFKNVVDLKPLFGIEMLRAFSKAKLVFNSHGGVAGNYAANIRLFEATGVGTCLVTDYKKNITDFFIPDKEVITYQNTEDCVEKVKWLLNHQDRMKEIAVAGQNRTLKEHTFYNRCVEMDLIIKKKLSSK